MSIKYHNVTKKKFLLCNFLLFGFLFCRVSDSPPILSQDFIGQNWPILSIQEKKADVYVSSTFGEPRGDHFHNGLDLAGREQIIYPLSESKKLFSHYVDYDPYQLRRGTGNIVLMDHGGSWMSGYYHLNDTVLHHVKDSLSLEDGVAYMGNSGRSTGAHLHFYLSHKYGREIVNPLVYLPQIEDPSPPVIKSLVLVQSSSRYQILPDRETFLALGQNHLICVDIADPGKEKSSKRGIYKLRWQLNQNPAQSLKFDKISYKKGKWYLQDLDFSQIYYKNLYYLRDIHFSVGKNILKIEAEDYASNKSQAIFYIFGIQEY